MLDLRLGGRMLVKHPALTAIATIAVAFAIAVGTVGFEIARQALWPTIPLPDGDAIVALRNWNVADLPRERIAPRLRAVARRSQHDHRSQRRRGGRTQHRRRRGAGQPETVANVTASTFALTRVPALMGRTLLEADERGDAEEVVVVGYDFWKNKLDGAQTPSAASFASAARLSRSSA